jgi:hypothetical protein
MAVQSGPKVETDGIIWYFDAANPDSIVSGETTWKNLIPGANHDGSLTNQAAWVGTDGGAISLDGTDDDIELTNATSINLGNVHTHFISFKGGDVGAGNKFILGPGGNDSDNFLRIRSGSARPSPADGQFFEFLTVQNDNTGVVSTWSTTPYETDTFYTICMVLNATEQKLYVNGKLEEYDTGLSTRIGWQVNQATVHQGGKYNIGSRPFTSDQGHFPMTIYSYIVYDRVLNDKQIEKITENIYQRYR